MTIIESFKSERKRMNDRLLNFAKRDIKRFFNLDTAIYKSGTLMRAEKEMIGLSSSMVLRCDDCIFYHLDKCFEVGVTDDEIEEVFSIALIIGGSILIPHLRRAINVWLEMKIQTVKNYDQKSVQNNLKIFIKDICKSNGSKEMKLKRIAVLLDRYIPYFNWSGFYLANETEKMLYLSSYVGAPTNHTKIPYGEGICGQAATTHKTFVVDDVNTENNYLACSVTVNSELVVPIIKNGKFLGEIDIDSNQKAAFNDNDRKFLEDIANMIGNFL